MFFRVWVKLTLTDVVFIDKMCCLHSSFSKPCSNIQHDYSIYDKTFPIQCLHTSSAVYLKGYVGCKYALNVSQLGNLTNFLQL